jgi:hypothetical protein
MAKRYRKVKIMGMNIFDAKTGQTAVAFWLPSSQSRQGHLYVVPKNKLKQVI